MTVRWTFEDPVAMTTYTFEINPLDGGSPSRTKNFGTENTLAPGGNVVIYEGQRPILTQEFSGTILTQDHYVAFVVWWEKSYPIRITDDLGRTFDVVFESFEPKRVYSPSRPWKHTYTVRTKVLALVDLGMGGYAGGYGGGYT